MLLEFPWLKQYVNESWLNLAEILFFIIELQNLHFFMWQQFIIQNPRTKKTYVIEYLKATILIGLPDKNLETMEKIYFRLHTNYVQWSLFR